MSISQRTVNLFKRSQNYTVSPFESSKTKTEKETLDDLENDEEYIKRSSRFLESIGSNDNQVDDMYSYIRDADWNLAVGAQRAFKDMPSFTEQQKNDYRYLKSRFDNADTGSIKQYLKAAGDIGIDMATDPTAIPFPKSFKVCLLGLSFNFSASFIGFKIYFSASFVLNIDQILLSFVFIKFLAAS